MNGIRRYCASAGCDPIDALLAWRRGTRDLPAWEQFAGRFVVPTHLGRVAIALLPRIWNLQPGDEVLAPSYNCGSEVDPLVHAGLQIVFYRVDRGARIDVEDIHRRVTDRTRMVYVTHYFGWGQDLRALSAWCRERGLFLVEDCALSLFSGGADGPLGLQGDAAIFSLRKGLPVPDGGVLTLRKAPSQESPRLHQPPWWTTGRALLPLFKRHLLRATESLGLYPWLRIGLERLRRPLPACQDQCGALPDIPASYYFRDSIACWGLSRVTAGLLHAIDPRIVRARRRENYLRLRDELAGTPDLAPLYPDLPEGVCPLCMPVLVVNGRSRIADALTHRGIIAFPFWEGYHKALHWDGFPEARFLKDRTLTLPVDQALDRRHMAYIARTVRELVREYGVKAPPTCSARPRGTCGCGIEAL